MKRTAFPSTRLGLLSLATLAAFAGSAHAETTLKLTGTIDISVGSSRAPNGAGIASLDSGNMSTSWIGFEGNEELGGGWNAIFQAQEFLRADTGATGRFTGDGQFSRAANVGLKHAKYGTLTGGRNTTPLFVSTLMFNAFGDSFGYSPAIRQYFTSGTVTGDTGWNDSALYTSPSLAGFTLGVIGALGEGSGGRNWGYNLGYARNALGLSYSQQSARKDNSPTSAVDDTRTSQIGASYVLGMVKLFAQAGDVQNLTTDTNYKIGGLGATLSFGKGSSIMLQAGKITPGLSTLPTRTTVSLGYDRALSKRTDVYLVGMSEKVDNLTDGGSFSLGVRHSF
jgi:predicted porin